MTPTPPQAEPVKAGAAAGDRDQGGGRGYGPECAGGGRGVAEAVLHEDGAGRLQQPEHEVGAGQSGHQPAQGRQGAQGLPSIPQAADRRRSATAGGAQGSGRGLQGECAGGEGQHAQAHEHARRAGEQQDAAQRGAYEGGRLVDANQHRLHFVGLPLGLPAHDGADRFVGDEAELCQRPGHRSQCHDGDGLGRARRHQVKRHTGARHQQGAGQ
ncbi:hypothetical protein [Streptomyces sp. NPDC056165]|uniref:hypothetical protein n=1 Tax=Streptomyces sp. NPDC056165 TaxID=3345733 RepID=UPI0035DA57FE